jgi:hypothetical protein
VIAQWLRSDEQRFRSDFQAITKWLRSDSKVVPQQLHSDYAAVVKLFRSEKKKNGEAMRRDRTTQRNYVVAISKLLPINHKTILQWLQSDRALQNDRTVIALWVQSDCAVIAKLSRSNCKAISQWLVIAERSHSDWKTFAQQSLNYLAVIAKTIAQWLLTDRTAKWNNCAATSKLSRTKRATIAKRLKIEFVMIKRR